ncbi:MvdC/MvdD family ATP grasp protein [Streptosporangium sp. NPDC004379]|uniref:MvdC/MvdD family ATP grasp protein n=1 Tax=Streptosporangium sp. NPDC004379 TaxID=3366189 RepID=UPI0036C1C390
MQSTQILIFTNTMDSHADVVIKKLIGRGHEPVRLNSDHLPDAAAISTELGDRNWTGGFRLSAGRAVDLERVRSVWLRRPHPYGVSAELSPLERAFAVAELEQTMGGLLASLDCYWMSRPGDVRAASWKPEQLRRAAAMGFEVPRTLITTDPEAVRAFHAECGGRTIFKSMAGPSALVSVETDAEAVTGPPPSLEMPTTLLGEAELAALEAVRLAPCLFQEYVDKDRELRVTVIGDEVFAAEIHSQERPETAVDVRRFDVDVPYRAARLPDETAALCLEFVHSYGLTFGALDLILTPDGRYVFLENNPVGQFFYVEERVPELRMTDALAGCLINAGGPS